MEGEGGTKRRVCVTGAGGFVASWLVKLLLSKGYFVHGTVRDPNDEKNRHLKRLEGSRENLQIFHADLLDYSSIFSAITGCEGVFHVASPVLSRKASNPEVELLSPAVTGTLNVLRACSEAKIKRVIVVSSVAAVIMNPNWPKDRAMDEECWSDIEYCKKTEEWYYLAKTLAERQAQDYGDKYGLDVITFCPTLVIGPLLQAVLNTSSLLLISLFKGPEYVKSRTWTCVDVRDVADAMLLLYENSEASGRYICAPHQNNIHDLVDILKRHYPNYDYSKDFNIGLGSPLVAKLWALIVGLWLAWSYGYLGVIVESDSMAVVQFLNGDVFAYHSQAILIHQCSHMLNQHWHCSIQHIY